MEHSIMAFVLSTVFAFFVFSNKAIGSIIKTSNDRLKTFNYDMKAIRSFHSITWAYVIAHAMVLYITLYVQLASFNHIFQLGDKSVIALIISHLPWLLLILLSLRYYRHLARFNAAIEVVMLDIIVHKRLSENAEGVAQKILDERILDFRNYVNVMNGMLIIVLGFRVIYALVLYLLFY